MLVAKQEAGFPLSAQVGTKTEVAGKEKIATKGPPAKIRFVDKSRLHAEIRKPSARIVLAQMHSISRPETDECSGIAIPRNPSGGEVQVRWYPECLGGADHPVAEFDAMLTHPTKFFHGVRFENSD